MRVILFLLMLIPSTAWAWEDWDQSTRDQFAASSLSIVMDWHSTDMLARDNWQDKNYYEKNRILGRYPSREKLALYMIGRIGLDYYLYDNGFEDVAFFGGLVHTYAAINNYQLDNNDDKIGHAIAGAAISFVVSEYTDSKVKGCIAAFAAGVIKETIDNQTHSGDFDDALATGIGCSFTLRF